MDLSKQFSVFDDAVLAFEIRFRGVSPASRWDLLEHQATQDVARCPFETRSSALSRFFEEAERAVGNVVHEYFPKLLQVATVQREHLGPESPFSWTGAWLFREVCRFLGIDEKLDPTSIPETTAAFWSPRYI